MWKNVNINKQNIKAESGKAVLINCPHNSNYDGYAFWHPSKVVRQGRNSNSISLGYTDDFTFKLIKYGKGKYNSRDIIDEIEISVEEFEEMFGVMNENITSPKEINVYETHKPEEKEPIKDNLKEDLIDE